VLLSTDLARGGRMACRFILSNVRNIDVNTVTRNALSLYSRATVSCGSVYPALNNYATYYPSRLQVITAAPTVSDIGLRVKTALSRNGTANPRLTAKMQGR
jgi:hypothetical protein